MAEPTKWQTLSSRIALDSPWLRVRQDTVRTGSGVVLDDYYVVERRDFAMIVALTAQHEVILVREYKHAMADISLQCPAGYLNDNEEPANAARRELLEETGYFAAELEPLGAYHISTGMATTRGHLFLCHATTLQLEQYQRKLDDAEEIAIELLPFEEALQRVVAGTLTSEIATVAALLLAKSRLSTR